MEKLMTEFGPVEIAENGRIGYEKFANAFRAHDPFHLILLDIMLPFHDGQEVLSRLRALERAAGTYAGQGVKVIMTTALSDKEHIMRAFRENCDAYLVKPIMRSKLVEQLRELKLID